jgi:hypothetical protein
MLREFRHPIRLLHLRAHTDLHRMSCLSSFDVSSGPPAVHSGALQDIITYSGMQPPTLRALDATSTVAVSNAKSMSPGGEAPQTIDDDDDDGDIFIGALMRGRRGRRGGLGCRGDR